MTRELELELEREVEVEVEHVYGAVGCFWLVLSCHNNHKQSECWDGMATCRAWYSHVTSTHPLLVDASTQTQVPVEWGCFGITWQAHASERTT